MAMHITGYATPMSESTTVVVSARCAPQEPQTERHSNRFRCHSVAMLSFTCLPARPQVLEQTSLQRTRRRGRYHNRRSEAGEEGIQE
jgi:hypothetical protein